MAMLVVYSVSFSSVPLSWQVVLSQLHTYTRWIRNVKGLFLKYTAGKKSKQDSHKGFLNP
jgi:hypothetical protein